MGSLHLFTDAHPVILVSTCCLTLYLGISFLNLQVKYDRSARESTTLILPVNILQNYESSSRLVFLKKINIHNLMFYFQPSGFFCSPDYSIITPVTAELYNYFAIRSKSFCVIFFIVNRTRCVLYIYPQFSISIKSFSIQFKNICLFL